MIYLLQIHYNCVLPLIWNWCITGIGFLFVLVFCNLFIAASDGCIFEEWSVALRFIQKCFSIMGFGWISYQSFIAFHFCVASNAVSYERQLIS